MENSVSKPAIVADNEPPKETTSNKREKLMMRNTILLSLAFGINFFGTNAFMNFAVPLLGNLGATCMAVVNLVNSFSNFLVPTVISFFKTPERTILVCAFSYLLYIGQFSYIIPLVSYLVCSLHGFLSAMVWASQGIILGNNSTDKDRGKKSGIFMAIYMFGSAMGNFASGFLVDLLHITADIHNGWNGSASILFLFMAISASLCVIPLSLIKRLDKSHTLLIVDSVNHEKSERSGKSEKTDGQEKLVNPSPTPAFPSTPSTPRKAIQPSILQEIKNVCKCLFSPRMRWLICFFFFDGYQQVFITSHFTRQVVDVSSVGTIMGIYSIVDVLSSFVHGWLSDRCGHLTVVLVASFFEVLGIIISWFANAQQNWLNIATGVILAISDAGYQTECLATVNSFFADDRTNANSSFRMLQCFGFAVSLMMMPLFVTGDAHHSNPTQYFYEVLIAFLLAIGSCIGYLIFIQKEKKKTNKQDNL